MTKLNELINKIYENPIQIIDFYKAILNEDVFIISNKEKTLDVDYIEIKKEPTELQLVLIEKMDKTPILPIFSSLEDLKLSKIEDKEIVKIPFKDVLLSIKDLQIVINPYSEKSKEFSLEEIEDLRKGNIFNSDSVPNKLFYLLKNVVDTQTGYEQFYKELYQSEVFIYAQNSEDETAPFNFISLVHKDTNEEVIPVFCSLEEAILMNQEMSIRKVKLIEVFKVFQNKNDIKIILNPNSQYCKVFIKEEIDDIISRKILEMVVSEPIVESIHFESQENISIRKPEKDYYKLLDNTATFFDKHGEVYAAYLVETLVNNKYEPLIIVDVDTKDDFTSFVKDLNNYYNECSEFSAPLISRFKFNDEISQQLIELIKPFYLKK